MPLRAAAAAALASTLILQAGLLSAQHAGSAEAPRAERRALALEDYYRVRSVGSPRISPDGEWVTYTVSVPVEETNGNARESWLVRTNGRGAPVRITHEGADIPEAVWHEDGRLRYTHAGATWLAHPARLDGTRERTGEASPAAARSPDGRWIARVRDVPPPEPPSPRRTAFEQRHAERFRGHEFDWYPFLRDGQRMPIADPRAASPAELFLEPAGGGAARQLTRLGLRPTGVEWAPDGGALLFSANDAWRDELRYGTSDLFLVRLDGTVTRLTEDGYTYSGASFSPDGSRIAYVRGWGTDMIVEGALEHGGPTDLYVQRLDGSAPVNLTAEWDLEAGSPTWSPDGRWIYFTSGIGGGTHLFRVESAGGRIEQITTGERRIQSLDIDGAFRRMTYTVGELDRPSDVWVADIDGRNERRLTDEHRALLAEVELGGHASRTVRWRSYDGTPVEGFLIYPHGYDPDGGPYPLIIVNHGGPHSASGYRFSFKDHFFAANGYFVLLPNFRASTGYGEAFKWGTWGAWGEKDGEDVLSGVDHLIAQLPIDGARVGTTGHSYGGIITNWLITRYPDRFAAAVSGAGESNWTSNFALSDIARTKETEFFGRPWEPRAQEIMIRQSPYLNCGGARTPTLFVHGEIDYRVPLSGALQLYTCLKKQGVPAKMLIYEGQAHSISGHWNNVHRMMSELEWWNRYLKAAGDTEITLGSAGESSNADIFIERNVPVRMRDGVTLYADIYRPAGAGPFPALLMRTPYDKTGETQSARGAMTEAAVRRGYVVVVQDTRGQFESEGFFTPYHQERDDGYDSIEWVAALPYVDGRVGTFGLSYPGAVQWMAAVTAPSALAAISPSQTFAHHNHFTYHGGVFSAGFLNWMLGRQFAVRHELGLPLASAQELREAWARHGQEWLAYVPLGELPVMEEFPYWRKWIDHPIESDYWFPLDIEAQHERVTVPALNLTGWHDDSYGQPGAIRNFTGMRARGATEAARSGQRLIIGPWTHGVPSATRTTFGGVDWGPEATIDYVELQLRFFDYWLRGIDDGYMMEAPVRIFVMGDNKWRDEQEWPLARTHYTPLFLHAGRLATGVGTSASASFTYDPHEPATLPPSTADDGGAGAPRSTVLTYTSEPFAHATEITGHIIARLWVESTAADTDFTVRIFEVDRQGGTRRLTMAPGVLRTRYRSTEQPQPPQPLRPGEPTELEISLGYTSYVLPAGHRLRIHITGSLFPTVHPNTWEPFISREQAVRATQTVHEGGARASRIVLPVIPREP